ncbi:MAG TPA: hypothetical protein VFE16_00065 [Candidatus Cybelea sp.]|nr:hypothetical protein [Candidatus Cybelea sp.]
MLTDLQQLRIFLDTLEPFAEDVFSKINQLDSGKMGLRQSRITRRNRKTTRSILAKLRRQSTTLPQIQDLIGCRIVVPDIIDQDRWTQALGYLFPDSEVIDRRLSPQHGYRAVHAIVRQRNRRFEIQVRTILQDEWANFVEKIDDRLRLSLKYGVGSPSTIAQLQKLSEAYAEVENFQRRFEARETSRRGRFPKSLLVTYVKEYEKAIQQSYAAQQNRQDESLGAAPLHLRKGEGTQLRRAADVAFRDMREVEENASRFLRVMLWSSLELPRGTEIAIGPEIKETPRVVVLAEAAVEQRSDLASATFDDLREGHVYEITQPSEGEYLLNLETFMDIVLDADVDRRNLASMLNLEED